MDLSPCMEEECGSAEYNEVSAFLAELCLLFQNGVHSSQNIDDEIDGSALNDMLQVIGQCTDVIRLSDVCSLSHTADQPTWKDLDIEKLLDSRSAQSIPLSLSSIAQSFCWILTKADVGGVHKTGGAQALWLYSWLLSLPDAPCMSLFDEAVGGALLRGIKRLAASEYSKMDRKKKQHVDTNRIHEIFKSVLRNVVRALEDGVRLKQYQSLGRQAIETLTYVIGLPAAYDDTLLSACHSGIKCLISEGHGDPWVAKSTLFLSLSSILVGATSTTRATQPKLVHEIKCRALQLIEIVVEDGIRQDQRLLEAAAQYILLNNTEKATLRSSACAAICSLIGYMAEDTLRSFIKFIRKASESSVPGYRLISVEVVNAILSEFPERAWLGVALLNFHGLEEGKEAEGKSSGETIGELSRLMATCSLNGKNTNSGNISIQEQESSTTAGRSRVVPWGWICLAILEKRCSDSAITIRAKALQMLSSSLSEILSSSENFFPVACLASPDLLWPLTSSQHNQQKKSPHDESDSRSDQAHDEGVANPVLTPRSSCEGKGIHFNVESTLENSQENSFSIEIEGAGAEGFFQDSLKRRLRLARCRARDASAHARRGAVSLLEVLLRSPQGIELFLLDPMYDACMLSLLTDQSVIVRKATATAIYGLMANASGTARTKLADLWVNGCLPLVKDTEISINTLISEQFLTFLTEDMMCSQPISAIIGAISSGGISTKGCVLHSLQTLQNRGFKDWNLVVSNLVHLIRTSRKTEVASGSWAVLEATVVCTKNNLKWEFLESQYHQLSTKFESQDSLPLLRTMSVVARAQEPPDESLAEDLFERIMCYTLPAHLTSACMDALWYMSTISFKNNWIHRFMDSSMECIAELTKQVIPAEDNMYHHTPEERLEVMVRRASSACNAAGEFIVLHHNDENYMCDEVKVFTRQIMTLLQGIIASNPLYHLSKLSGKILKQFELLLAHAWICIGKLCFTDHKLAQKCITWFIKELKQTTILAVKNNIIIALSDLIVVHTSLVDPYISQVAECLGDPNELIRIQTLNLLCSLLNRDYVKCRSFLFYSLAICLIDDSPRVASMAEYAIKPKIVVADKKSRPDRSEECLAYSKFLDLLFILNDYHNLEKSFSYDIEYDIMKKDVTFSFQMGGPSCAARMKRSRVYTALLHLLNQEQKFGIVARMCQDILGGIVDGLLPLVPCSEVLHDALAILRMPMIVDVWKPTTKMDMSIESQLDASVDESDMTAAMGAASSRIISQMMKKHIANAIVPIIIELRQLLLEAQHPLLNDLIRSTACMLKDNTEEIENILVADRQLLAEILYEIRQSDQCHSPNHPSQSHLTRSTTRNGQSEGSWNIETSPDPASRVSLAEAPHQSMVLQTPNHAIPICHESKDAMHTPLGLRHHMSAHRGSVSLSAQKLGESENTCPANL